MHSPATETIPERASDIEQCNPSKHVVEPQRLLAVTAVTKASERASFYLAKHRNDRPLTGNQYCARSVGAGLLPSRRPFLQQCGALEDGLFRACHFPGEWRPLCHGPVEGRPQVE